MKKPIKLKLRKPSEKELKLIRNDDEFLEIAEAHFNGVRNYITNYLIKKQELLEDFFYKNLETRILQRMKLKIENELLQRKLRNNNEVD